MAYKDKYRVEFSDDRKTLISCPKEYKGEYSVPDGTKCIAKYAFLKCEQLTSVILPQSVVTIEENAFKYCTHMPAIKLPDALTSIGKDAFHGCYSLKRIEIPDNDDIGWQVRSSFNGEIKRRKSIITKQIGEYSQTCPQCGLQNLPADAQFCPECGSKLI